MSDAGKPPVLLVDDNEATRTLISAILQKDFSIESCSDGMEATERLRTTRYAAILLDLRMPQHDGFSVLDFLKEHDAAALRRVLVVTALLGHKELERARTYGVCGIVTKPFDVDTLLDAVRDCVGPSDGGMLGVFCSSTPVILLIADLLRQRVL